MKEVIKTDSIYCTSIINCKRHKREIGWEGGREGGYVGGRGRQGQREIGWEGGREGGNPSEAW